MPARGVVFAVGLSLVAGVFIGVSVARVSNLGTPTASGIGAVARAPPTRMASIVEASQACPPQLPCPPVPPPASCPPPTCPVCQCDCPAAVVAPAPVASAPVAGALPPLRTPIVLPTLRQAGYDCQKKVDFLVGFKDALVVEVGALDGHEATPLAALDNVRRVVSFEPTPSKANGIKNWFAKSQWKSKLEFRPYAVSNFSGTAQFHTPTTGASQQDSLGSVKHLFKGREKTTAVQVTRLDEQIKERIHFLKVDTQGHDDRVLYGAEGIIDKYGIDIIHFEVSPELARQTGGDMAGVLHWLHKKRYSCFDCRAFGPPPLEGPREYGPYIAAFGEFNFNGGSNNNHGKWTDVVCYQ